MSYTPVSPDSNNVIFLDIESAPLVKLFVDLDERLQKLFLKKFDHQRKPIHVKPLRSTQEQIKLSIHIQTHDRLQNDQELWDSYAAITAEFLKVKSICVGMMPFSESDDQTITVKMMYSEDEEVLLKMFAKTLDNLKSPSAKTKLLFPQICAHNGFRFDFPILTKKFIQHRLELPSEFKIIGKKQWNWSSLIDTMDMWSFGDYKGSVSLDLLAATLGLNSPKTVLEGLNPVEFYYKYGLQQLAIYCAGDLVPMINAYRLMHGKSVLTSVRLFDGVVGKLIETVGGEDPIFESAPQKAKGESPADKIDGAPSQEREPVNVFKKLLDEQASAAGSTYFADQEKLKSEKTATKVDEQIKKTYKPRGKKKVDEN